MTAALLKLILEDENLLLCVQLLDGGTQAGYRNLPSVPPKVFHAETLKPSQVCEPNLSPAQPTDSFYQLTHVAIRTA